MLRPVMVVWGALVALLVMPFPAPLVAQSSKLLTASTLDVGDAGNFGKTVPRSAESPTDDFVRYRFPDQCEQAMRRLVSEYWRDKRRDTVRYAPATDSVPTFALREGRRCASQFSIATTPVRELFGLSQLYLWTQQDSLARAALDRLMQANAKRLPAERAWPFYEFTTSLLAVTPVRDTLALAYLRRLDAMGPAAATLRMLAHTQMSQYALTVNDRATAESEARAALAASHQMSMNDRIDGLPSLVGMYSVLSRAVTFTRSSQAALAILDTAITDLIPLRPEGRLRSGIQSMIGEMRIPVRAVGTKGLPAVHADRWYGTNGDSVRPRSGRVTLLVFSSTSCSGACYETFAIMRRMHARYGDQLDLVFMTRTEGIFRNKLVTDPIIEADSAGNYYTRFMRLPAALAVEITPFHRIADGRRRNEQTSNEDTFALGGQGIVVDRAGVVRWTGNVQPSDEALMSAVIGEAVAAKP